MALDSLLTLLLLLFTYINQIRSVAQSTHTHTHTLTAGRTGEARVVVEVPHGLAGLAGPKHPLAAFHTGSCKGKNTAVSGERNSVM